MDLLAERIKNQFSTTAIWALIAIIIIFSPFGSTAI